MARHIRLLFLRSKIEVIATLLDKDAPATCDHVVRLLEQPQEVTVEMIDPSAGALFFAAPQAADLPRENVTGCPAPGDLVLLPSTGTQSSEKLACSIGVFYRRGTELPSSGRWATGNTFATVTQNLEGLQQVARDVAERGPQLLRIERVPSCPMPFLRNGIAQVGIVVPDLDRAVERYWHLFGIGPWRFYTYGKSRLKINEYHGEASESTWRIALCWVGPLCLELIEDGEGQTVFADFIEAHGYGVHHLAVEVDDMAKAIAEAQASGFEVLQQGAGQGADGSGHFAYLNTEGEIGTTIELVQYPRVRVPPDRIYPPEG